MFSILNPRSYTANDHQRIWRIAVPMILSGMTTPLVGLVDTAMMGHLPEPQYLGAVAVGAMVLQLLFWAFGFLRMSTTGFTAQAHGRGGGGDATRALLGRALLLALSIALLLIALQLPIKSFAFYLLETTDAVAWHARRYFDIRVWSAPAVLINYVLIGWFLGNQNAKFPLLMMFTTNCANILLDILLVLVFKMSIDGVAFASVIAEILGLLVGIWLLKKQLVTCGGHWPIRAVLDLPKLLAMMDVNKDIFVRTLGLLFAFSFFTSQSARMGELVLAANGVLLNFQYAMSYGLDGFAHAAEALTGKAVGANDSKALKRDVRLTGIWSGITALGFTLFYYAFGTYIVNLITDIESVRACASDYLFWVFITPLFSVWAFWLDGVFIGMNDSKALRNSMLISLFFAFFPAWFILYGWGNNGLWAAFLLFMLSRGLTLGCYYFGTRCAVIR